MARILPAFEQLETMAKEGSYRRIPVWQEVLADAYTPVEVMRRLRANSKHCFLLESASQTESWGRYTFLGYDPTLEITCQDGDIRMWKQNVDGSSSSVRKQVQHPGEVIRAILSQYKSPMIPELPPFTGGLVGYFSYDYIKYAEPKLKLSGDADFKDMDLMLFNNVIAFDHYRQRVYVISGVDTGDLQASYNRAIAKIGEIISVLGQSKKKKFRPLRLLTDLEPKFDKAEFSDMVNRAKHYIHEGDIFQVVLSNPLRAKAEGNLFDTYRMLRASNPSPYMFYFTSEDIEIAGASPETLVSIDQGRIKTFPLAGSRPRGQTPEEDAELEQDLLADEKELAEHNMLVDLGRNDIGKISRIGSVQVEKYLDVQRFSHIMHIGSTVTGVLREDKDAVDAIDAILPAGTLSGAPKFRACQIIEELEKSQRGIYGGAIGYLDFAGNLDVCIAIRLAYKKNNLLTIRSGAGIVADSVPEKEYIECQNKAKAVVKAIEESAGILSSGGLGL